jgi:hypothetical protein
MTEVLVGLASGEALKAIFARRSKSVDEKSISAASKEALALKIAAEEADGWRVVKRNKTSLRVAKDKPADRQLEDDVWSLLYRLGFKEMNADRTFAVKVDANAPARQLDVFATDDETVFIVECTQARDGGPKSVMSLIDKICAIREDLIKVTRAHYGRDTKLKIKCAIAIGNIELRAADKSGADEAGIPIINDADIIYFTKLADILKGGGEVPVSWTIFTERKS